MKLNEWKQMNNTTPAASSSSSGVSNKSFKKRFDKLISYYGQHLTKEVSYLDVTLLTKDTLAFSEVYKKGDKIDFNISITDFDDESWIVKVETDGFRIATLIGSGWVNLLKKLRSYITVPVVGIPEYNDLLQEDLTEWVVMNNNKTSSTGYKKRFERLIKYHIDHSSSELESVTRKDIKDESFVLGEHYNTGSSEFDREIAVSVDKTTNTFYLNIFVNGKQVYHNDYESYEEVLEILIDTYMYLPAAGTQDYDDLLTESLREWKSMNSSTPTNSKASSQPATSTLYKDKFKKLLDYHIANDYHIKHGNGQGAIELLSEDSDKALFKYKETWEDHVNNKHENITAAAYFKGDSTWWVVRTEDGQPKEDFIGDGFNELIKKLYRYFTLPATNSSEYQALLEETDSSIADDYKLYENLWN
jgi:hypothetical protein